jgi:hypothetical protein
MLVVFHFAFPILLLLSRNTKKNPRLLGSVAAALLFMRLVDLVWLVGPELHRPGILAYVLHAAAVAGLCGLWVFAFTRELADRPLLPAGEPDVRELMEPARG